MLATSAWDLCALRTTASALDGSVIHSELRECGVSLWFVLVLMLCSLLLSKLPMLFLSMDTGMTLDRVVMKLDKCFDDGMAYGEHVCKHPCRHLQC